MSEEIKFKENESLRSNAKLIKKSKNKDRNDVKTTINEEIKHRIDPLVHIRQIPSLSESVINYFAIGICFFIYGCHELEWFKINDETNQNFYLGYFLVSGIILYIIGIFNWYEGKELIYLINFCLSFLFIALFFKNQKIENFAELPHNDKLEGIFYILLFSFIFIIGISSKDKGYIFIFDYAVLFATYVFLFAYKFYKNEIIKKIDMYLFIISGALYWITGLFKLFNSLMNRSIIIFEPSD